MFVDRDGNGNINGAFLIQQRAEQEELADDAAELLAFYDRPRLRAEERANARALLVRRADALAASDDVNDKLAALKIRLELVGG